MAKKGIKKLLFQIFTFLIPTQLAFHFWPSYSFIYGIRVDYLSPAIYLTDLLILIGYIYYLVTDYKSKLKITKRNIILACFAFAFVITNLYFSFLYQISIYKWLKLIILAGFINLNLNNNNFRLLEWFIVPFWMSLIFFGAIGIWQVLLGETTGLFYVFGERSFNIATPGIALLIVSGRNLLRPYSVFSHPNSLAGYYLVGFISSIFTTTRKKETNLLRILALIVCLLLLIFSFSKSVFITAVLLMMILFLARMKVISNSFATLIPFIMAAVSLSLATVVQRVRFPQLSFKSNILERVVLLINSGFMLSKAALFGVGLGSFVIGLSKFRKIFTGAWLLQPVHNIYLLITTETGLIGLIIFCLIVSLGLSRTFAKNNKLVFYSIIAICLTGFFDHYWVTLQQNFILMFMIIGLSLKKVK